MKVRNALALSALVFSHSVWANFQFSSACERGTQMTIAAAGDIIAHQALQNAALASPTKFRSLWQHVEGLFHKADVAYANLEAPAAKDLPLTSKQFSFNFHPQVVRDLKASGFDVISTANNHSLDRGNTGIDRTIETFWRENLAHMGTFHSNGKSTSAAITQQGGVTLAWLACTDLSNNGSSTQLQTCRSKNFLNAIAHYRALRGIDGVIVTPHWGVEKASAPSGAQRSLAKTFFEAGAIAIFGAHPHVLQRWEKMIVNGEERFVAYSLGNFISNQIYFGVAQQTSAVLYLGLTKTTRGLVINGVRFTPIMMTRSPYFSSYPVGTQASLSTHRRHTFAHFDAAQELLPNQKLITNPQCSGVRVSRF